tara:strand:- start:211 stop:519 length:309 start_codon:yes stop_codon:yes gene_type:complete
MENIEQLIQQAADKDYAAANTTFVDIMNQKLADTLEQEKIKVSGEIYNGLESEEDEQLELDLDDEEESEEDEATDETESEEDEVDVEDEPDTDESDEDAEES